MSTESFKDRIIIIFQFIRINLFKAVLPLLSGILIYYLAYYLVWLLWLKTILMVGGAFLIIQGAIFLGLSFVMRKDINFLRRIRVLEGLKKEALNGNLEVFLKVDEEEIIDRKREKIQADKLVKLIVAMSNRYGGVIIIGVDDQKNPFYLDGIQRDTLSNQFENICADNVIPSIKVEPIPIVKENDLGILTVFIPKARLRPVQVKKDGIHYQRIGRSNRIMTEEEVRKYRKLRY